MHKIAVAAVSLLIVVYQFLPMAHFFIPYQVAGKNVYTVAPAALMLLVFIVLWPGIKRTSLSTRVLILLGMLLLMWTIVFTARLAFYEESGDILFQRFVLTLFIYSALFMHLTRNPDTRELMSACILVVGVSQAILGIVHAYMFPFIQLVPDKNDVLVLSFEGSGTREVGTLVSASLFANVIVCAQFVLMGEKRLPFFFKLILMGLMAYAVTLTGSRYPIMVSLLLAACVILNRRVDRTVPILLSAVVLVALIVVLSGGAPIEFKGILRFDQGYGGRFEKLMLGIDLISSHWWYVLIGAPGKMIAAATTAGGVTLSDNSYVLISLQFGLPLLLVWLAGSFALIVRRPPGLLASLMVIYFFLNLGITNSVLWEPWLFYFPLALWVVRRRSVGGELRLTASK